MSILSRSRSEGNSRWLLPLLALLALALASMAALAQSPVEAEGTSAVQEQPAPETEGDAAEPALPSDEETVVLEVPEVPEVPVPPVELEAVQPRRAPEARELEERERDRRRPPKDAQVTVGSSLTVEADELARDVIVLKGDLTIDGEVLGDAVAIGGDVEVNGRVSGDVLAVGGSVVLGADADVLGSVTSIGDEVDRHPGAAVGGSVNEVELDSMLHFGWWPTSRVFWGGDHGQDWFDGFFLTPFGEALKIFWKIFALMLLSLLACLVLLLARTPVERVARKVEAEVWKAGLAGLLAQVLFVPVLVFTVVVLAISIIGIPLLLLVPFALIALVLMGLVGYTGVAYSLGSWSERRFGWSFGSPFLAVLLGVLWIEMWGLGGHLLDLAGGPIWIFAKITLLFAFAVEYLAWTVGFGAALLTRFGTSDSWSRGYVPPPPAAPPARTTLDSAVPPASAPSELRGTSGGGPDAADSGSAGGGETPPRL